MAIAGDDPRKKRIGFCKLLGENMEHYAQKYEINIGRKSKATDLDVVIGDLLHSDAGQYMEEAFPDMGILLAS